MIYGYLHWYHKIDITSLNNNVFSAFKLFLDPCFLPMFQHILEIKEKLVLFDMKGLKVRFAQNFWKYIDWN